MYKYNRCDCLASALRKYFIYSQQISRLVEETKKFSKIYWIFQAVLEIFVIHFNKSLFLIVVF